MDTSHIGEILKHLEKQNELLMDANSQQSSYIFDGMASVQNTNFPPPLPPPPSSDSNTTVIIVVFVSIGGLFFIALLLSALCCFIKMRKQHKQKAITEADIVNVDEHMKVNEAKMPIGLHGEEAVVMTIEDDVHVQEMIRKEVEEDRVGEELKGKSAQEIVAHALQVEASSSGDSACHRQHNIV